MFMLSVPGPSSLGAEWFLKGVNILSIRIYRHPLGSVLVGKYTVEDHPKRCLAFCETAGHFSDRVLYQPTVSVDQHWKPLRSVGTPTRTKLQSCEVGLHSSIQVFYVAGSPSWPLSQMVGWTEKKDQYFRRDLSSTNFPGDYYFMGLWLVVVNDRCLLSPIFLFSPGIEHTQMLTVWHINLHLGSFLGVDVGIPYIEHLGKKTTLW